MKILNRMKELWKHNVLRYAIVLHSFYFILSIILFFMFFQEKNDFIIFYRVGGIFLNDTENLYNQTNYLWDFRYFPLSALFFIPFGFLDFRVSFIIFNLFNLFLNTLICIVLYKIIIIIRNEDHEKDDKRVILYISIYLMSLPHVLNYIYGQVNLYITLFILISLYIFIKFNNIKWQFIASIILGVSIIIKPTGFFIIPFLIAFNYDLSNKQIHFDFIRTLARLLGVLLPLSLNFIVFIIYPKSWKGFLETNFTGSNPIALNFSFSISKLLTNFCYFYNIPFNQSLILISIICFFSLLGFLIYIFRRFDENSIIYGYIFAILIILLSYFDSWDHHLLTLTPLLIIIIFDLPIDSQITISLKPSFFFFNFFNLAFVGIWYLIYPLFPYNFECTIFLMITFYEISKFCLTKKRKNYNYNLNGGF